MSSFTSFVFDPALPPLWLGLLGAFAGLLMACAQVGAPARTSVYVGDHERDIEAGRRAGMLTIGALFGYLNEGEDPQAWRADHYISRAEELLPLLSQHFPSVERA